MTYSEPWTRGEKIAVRAAALAVLTIGVAIYMRSGDFINAFIGTAAAALLAIALPMALLDASRRLRQGLIFLLRIIRKVKAWRRKNK